MSIPKVSINAYTSSTIIEHTYHISTNCQLTFGRCRKGSKNGVFTTENNRRQYTFRGAVKPERTILSGGNPWD